MSERGQRDWDVECTACGLTVGEIVDGHFVHHDECGFLPRIANGVMRCCACGGELSGRARPVVEPAIPPPPAAILRQLERRRPASQRGALRG